MFNMNENVFLELETALKNNDIDFAKKLLEENPKLQDYINKKLYALAKAHDTFFHAVLSEDESQEMRGLLYIGADPNYRQDKGLTLLEKAVEALDVYFTMTLLEHGVNPWPDPIETLADLTLETNSNFPHYSQQLLPIQRAYQNFMKNCFNRRNNEIFNCLSEAILETNGKELEEQFKIVFEQVIEEIKKAKEIAKTKNKRLMILIGENHEGMNSFVIELMVYLTAKECGINTVLTEQDQTMLDYFNRTGARLTRQNQWGAIISFLNIIKENKGEIIPIDIEQTKLLAEGVVGKSVEDVALRDAKMAQCAHEVSKNVVCVVGNGHLYGLLNKTDLETNFHVLPISTTIADCKIIQTLKKDSMTLEEFDKQSHTVKSNEFNATFPEKVKNYSAFQDAGYQSLMSPDTATAIVYKLFGALKPRLKAIADQEKKPGSRRP